jgi:hypothetical protein
VLRFGKYSRISELRLRKVLASSCSRRIGKLTRGDTVMSYIGHWRTDGEQFEATLFTSRHSPGEPTAFGGIDDLEITLTGRSKGGVTASCTGTADA